MPHTQRLTQLNAKTATYAEPTAHVTGERLSPMDIAAALAGLPDNAYYLGRYVYAGDETVYPTVLHQGLMDLSLVCEIQGWQVKSDRTLTGMLKLGLEEIAQERLCPRCQGKTWHSHNCPVCKGTGRQSLSNYQRAKRAGIHRGLWNRYWGPRYERHVFRYYLALLNQVQRHLRRKLA